jgi:hypothetical protein
MVGEIKRTKNQQILKKLTKVNGACKDMFVCANRWRSVGGGLQIALPTKQFGQKKTENFSPKTVNQTILAFFCTSQNPEWR